MSATTAIRIDPFYLTVEKVERKGARDTKLVNVWSRNQTQKLGTYERMYGAFEETTFYPFERDGEWYALYSADYQRTSVAKLLPEFTPLGEEPREGFCPVAYLVPRRTAVGDAWPQASGEFFPFGLVAGCVWGDDSSWKVEYLDLSRAPEGIIERSDPFGYLEFAGDSDDFASKVVLEEHEGSLRIMIPKEVSFGLRGGTFQQLPDEWRLAGWGED